MGLEIAIGAGDVSDFYAEEDVAIVVGPLQMSFDGLVVGEAAGRRAEFLIASEGARYS